MQVKIKAALAHKELLQKEEAQKEIADIQEYIDRCVPDLEENKIYFIPLRGTYTHVKRALVLNGVIISTMQDEIIGMEGRLCTEIKESMAKVAALSFGFPPEFLGKISYAEGFPIHFEMPVKGLSENMQIPTSALLCSVENVKVLKQDKEENE